ncbi:MAG TPA: patatin-like phospholipase family protein, partial [Longimicrobiales bacterium]|nr:patatin-like phospholipase family protein [Longimicrobiales bacterium]
LALACAPAPGWARQDGPDVLAGEPEPAAPLPATIGLALSGGGAKGIAHVGVLRALERLGVRVDVVAGTSMGSVVGGMYALGLSVDSIEAVIASADWPALLGDVVARERRSVEQRRLDERAILSVPLDDGSLGLPTGAVVGSNVLRTLEHVTWRAAAERRFDELPRPFVAVATDLETGEPVPVHEGVLAEALRASSGVPGAVEPIVLEGRMLVDGALSRNLPASDARDLGADVVICSDVSDPLDSAEELVSVVDVLSQLASLAMMQSTVRQRELCDVLLTPELEGMSGLTFDRTEEWVRRGEEAVTEHAAELRAIAARPPRAHARAAPPPTLLQDSVRVASVAVVGSDDAGVVELVRRELDVEPGTWVTRDELDARLGTLDATGLFGLVHYRLDPAARGFALTVSVEERARNRLGLGLRYDDERRAALLFTATLHNVLRYGSVARFDLRVGEETRVAGRLGGRLGVTGPFSFGVRASWSEGRLRLPGSSGELAGVDVASATATVGLEPVRGTFVGVEGTLERLVASAAPDVRLRSASVVLDHESLDRVDFPRAGADVRGRVEGGVSDVASGGDYGVATLEARAYLPLDERLTLEAGGFLGRTWGADLPPQRRLRLGGAHRSAVFGAVHPLFQGLERQAQTGAYAQVGRLGLRWEVWSGGFVRAGMDVGGVRDAWRFPIETRMTGWSLSFGMDTLVGPVVVEASRVAAEGHDVRISVGVGRFF